GRAVAQVALDDLLDLLDGAGEVLVGVDLGQRDAVGGVVRLDRQDAAVGLDRRAAVAGGEEDARQAALQRHRGVLAAALHGGVGGVDEQGLGGGLVAGVRRARGQRQRRRRVARVVLGGPPVVG